MSSDITLLPTLLSSENVPLRQHTFHWRFHHMPTDMGKIFLGNNCYRPYRLLSQVDPGGEKPGVFVGGLFQRGCCRRSLQMPVFWSERIPGKQVDDHWAGLPTEIGGAIWGFTKVPRSQGHITNKPSTLYEGCQVLNLTTCRCERFRKFFSKRN